MTIPAIGHYEIDTSGSTITFATRHMFGLAPVHGTFGIRAGTVDVAEPLADSRVHVEIEAASFHTGDARRDGSVLSARFLDADRHPVLTFDAGRLDGTDLTRTLTGTLTVCGVDRPITLSIREHTVAPRSFTVRATTRVDRVAFGVTAARGMAGRHLDLTVAVRAVRT